MQEMQQDTEKEGWGKRKGLQELWGSGQKSPTIIPWPGGLEEQMVEWLERVF